MKLGERVSSSGAALPESERLRQNGQNVEKRSFPCFNKKKTHCFTSLYIPNLEQ